jgi:hypothetical protein
MATNDTWLVSVLSGRISHVTSGVEATLLESADWKAFSTEAAAEAFAKESLADRQKGIVTGAAGSAVKGAVSAVTGGSVFGVHFATGALRAMVVRTVKVILGLAMVIVGVMHLTGTSQALTKAAKTAGIAAVAE